MPSASANGYLSLVTTPVPDVAAGDEGRHRRGPEPLWGESWYFDFAAPDASVAGFVRLALYPNLGVAWYWAALVGRGRRLVLVRDHELEPPRGRDLEVRGQGIWSTVTCETPLDHWSIGLEAFAVALDDPLDAFRGERGDRIGLGFDLEWEATAPAVALEHGCYGQPCRVTGEILVADEQVALDGPGARSHHWGVEDWWAGARPRASGVLDDGAFFAVAGEGPPRLGHDGLPASAAFPFGDLSLTASVLAPAPLLLEAPDGRVARLTRSLCRYRVSDGRGGFGWADWLQI